jgi:sugar phosphate isomerase/epimerase
MKTKGLGIYTWFGYVLPTYEEKLRLIKSCGFDAVATWWGDEFSESNRRTQAEIAYKCGLALQSSHIPYFTANLLWYDNLEGKGYLTSLKETIQLASDSGVDTLVIHPYERFIPEGLSMNVLIDNYRRLGDTANHCNVKLAVENLFENEIYEKLLEKIWDNPNIGICFDTGHNHVTNGSDYFLLRDYGEKLFAIHAHDNHGDKDEHLLPLEGTIPWQMLLRELDKTCFGLAFMLESAHPYEGSESDTQFVTPTDLSAEEYLRIAFENVSKVVQEYEAKVD